MNENEIITALECCEMQSYPACRECPYHDHYSNGNCISQKNADIKDLIKILKEENEELKCRTQNLTSDLTSAKAEVERLEKAFVILKNHNNHLEKVGEEYVEAIIRLEKLNETAKSEARKEFAERLKEEKSWDCPYETEDAHYVMVVCVGDIDDLLAEMESERG